MIKHVIFDVSGIPKTWKYAVLVHCLHGCRKIVGDMTIRDYYQVTFGHLALAPARVTKLGRENFFAIERLAEGVRARKQQKKANHLPSSKLPTGESVGR